MSIYVDARRLPAARIAGIDANNAAKTAADGAAYADIDCKDKKNRWLGRAIMLYNIYTGE